MAVRTTRMAEAMVNSNNRAVNQTRTMVIASNKVMDNNKAMANSKTTEVKVVKGMDSNRILENRAMDKLHHNISNCPQQLLIPRILDVTRSTKAIRTNTAVKVTQRAIEASWEV